MLKSVPFAPPAWASALRRPPPKKLGLGHFPTPILPFVPPGLPEGVRMFIKRDDFSGMETSGNKIRKLEFLLAEALEQKADCIVTCGGIQSNHCRATAAVARMLGLDSYLLLRTNKPDEDPGLVGNVLFDRMLDANLIQMSRQEYGKSQVRLELCPHSHVEVAYRCINPAHAYIVCDNDEYFHGHIDNQILPAMGAPPDLTSRQFLQITNAQGTGYARSTKKELEFIYSVSRKTGVLMDPVYSGKALFHLIRELNEAPEVRNRQPYAVSKTANFRPAH
ncbi:unnamed protein product [Phytophthora fragariaefolia]|uniref:Unnamed protein product n=1 Tax=Phytophthora fragariaefolia TaxID=1490495 RepID=A0A9W6X714_9STRA|nr:unnamed protein product [Phytophthora fragariaefolia]